jgi:hypothetical protein
MSEEPTRTDPCYTPSTARGDAVTRHLQALNQSHDETIDDDDTSPKRLRYL